MPLIDVTIAHGQTLEEAQRRLETVVREASARFGLRRVEWSPDRRRVKLEGAGALIEMWVDAQVVHVTGDLPGLGGLLSGPLTSGLKQLLDRTFRKQLP
jgi:Putative polyhydroxyalkanoic acid system protein (PHA_gran_rgn)